MKTKNSSEQKQVFIVDDHAIVRFGISRMIMHEPDLRVCGEAADANSALINILKIEPDIAILDLSLKDLDGIKLTRLLRQQNYTGGILILSMHDENLYAQRAIRAGANGFVNKSDTAEKLIESIRSVLKGEIAISASIKDALISMPQKLKIMPEIDELSDRERQVFLLIGQGQTIQSIASMLSLSPKTVDSHRERIKDKLNLPSGKQLFLAATKWVLKEGLAGPSL